MNSAIRLSAILCLAGLLIADRGWAQGAEPAHFHHVHLNSTDPDASLLFYQRHLGAVAVKYRGKVDALFTERSFIFVTKVEEPPKTIANTSLSHIGWGGKDGPSEYEWLKQQGVEFNTPATPLGDNYYMYFYCADHELIEIFTGGQNYRFNHVHLWCTNPDTTAKWFGNVLGLPYNGPRPRRDGWFESNGTRLDNVGIVMFGRPDFETPLWPKEMGDEFQPTKGTAIDHIAFSYRDIGPVFDRMKNAEVEIAEPIAIRSEGFKSFSLWAPTGF